MKPENINHRMNHLPTVVCVCVYVDKSMQAHSH